MKRHLARNIFAVLAFLAVAALGQKPDWKDYAYPEDGFTISSPFKPTFEKKPIDTDLGKMEMHTYLVDIGTLGDLGLSVNDIRKFGDLPARELLQAAKNGSVTQVKGMLISEKEISLEGAPGIEYEMETAGDHSLMRCYYVNGRTITLVSEAKKGIPLFSGTERLFSSLRFIPAWKEYKYSDDGFAISGPSKPALQNKTIDTPEVQSHVYIIAIGDDMAAVGITSYGKGTKISPPEALQRAKNGLLQSVNGNLVSEKEVSLENNLGIEFELESEIYHARARYYLVNNKLITLMSFSGHGSPLPPGTTRIFDSLRLLKPQ